MKYNFIIIPSLAASSLSTILPHHPDAHGTVSIPISSLFSIRVMFAVNGSLQLPNSPLDLHIKHLCKPVNRKKKGKAF